ncbi:palindromic element RPE3 domain-containing protein [Rickettsia endosymbiont of Orchestes rusci]|uniref:palindromic element RPE3 domain-containing protein n=1 Tax=Rickettsia endosymbiont of Orchestes rusci TaxID=3066250 RepID=UPI00397C480E
MTLIISKDSQKFIEKLNPKQSRQIAIKIKELSEVIQLNSQSFRQDEFEDESAQRTKVREHRRVPKNSLVSSFVNDAVDHPHDSKLLKGSEEQYHRVDVGEFRIIYQKNKEIFYIFIIGKRNDAEVYKLFKRKIN